MHLFSKLLFFFSYLAISMILYTTWIGTCLLYLWNYQTYLHCNLQAHSWFLLWRVFLYYISTHVATSFCLQAQDYGVDNSFACRMKCKRCGPTWLSLRAIWRAMTLSSMMSSKQWGMLSMTWPRWMRRWSYWRGMWPASRADWVACSCKIRTPLTAWSCLVRYVSY